MKAFNAITCAFCTLSLLTSYPILAQTNPQDSSPNQLIWQDDFSDPTKWIFYNESEPDADWVITSDESQLPGSLFIPLELPTDSNGFALMNGDENGPGSTQDAYLEYNEDIDLTLIDNVSFDFYQAALNADTQFFVEFSVDGGIEWTVIEVNEELLSTGAGSSNPELVSLNLAELLSGQSSVRLRFRYLATWGFFWAIDDLSIRGIDLGSFQAEGSILEEDSLFICGGGPVEIIAEPGLSNYIWSTGDTTQSVVVSSSGTYTVSASYQPEFINLDTIPLTTQDTVYVSFIDLEITVPDTVISNGESVTLEVLVNTFSSITSPSGCQDLFISEYIVGAGNNRALEFYNPTSESIDLDDYVIQRWSNGEQSATDMLDLEGVVPPFGTWVVANGQTVDIDLGPFISPACDAELQALADQLGNAFPDPLYMNGNDALVLVKGEGTDITVLDIFGKPGEDPGIGWSDFQGVPITQNQTLIRKPEITQGVVQPPIQFLPSAEYIAVGTDVWTNLRVHESVCETSPSDLSILWSTGESGSSISVSPDTTTTYTVEVDNGIFTCSANVTVGIDTCLISSGVLSLNFGDDAFCLGNGSANYVQAEIADNLGLGRFGIADANTFDIINGSQNGLFDLNNYPPGDYLIGYVSFKEEDFFSGVSNVSDFDGCFQVSNSVLFSTDFNDGGAISTSSPTAFCVGDGTPSSLALELSGATGFNFKWVVLTSTLQQIEIISDSSTFSLEELAPGSYKLFHVAYGQGIDLSEVDPQSIGACVDVSNAIDLLAIECTPASIEVYPNPTSSAATVSFSINQDGMATLELFDLTGKMIRSYYRGILLEGEEKQIYTALDDLPRGVYVYRLTTPKGVFQEKVVLTQ